MERDTTDLQDAFRREAERRRRIDLRDFNAEVAGVDIGRAPRFHSAEFIERRRDARSGGGRGRAAQRDYASFLQLLLATNRAYAALYHDTLSRLREAEDATERAIARAQQALEEATAALDRTLARAARLPDGTRVFRDARGQVWSEHGRRVSDADAARIEWRGDEPSYERFKAESEALAQTRTSLEELQGYSVNTLGRIRDRMTDQENPPSTEEMQRLERDIQDNMPAAARIEITQQKDVASSAPSSTAEITVRPL